MTARHDDLLQVIIIVVGTAIVLALLSRRQRPHIHAALMRFSLAVFLIVTSAIPAGLGWLPAQTLHSAGQLLAGCALVKLGSIIVFDFLLGLTPFSPP